MPGNSRSQAIGLSKTQLRLVALTLIMVGASNVTPLTTALPITLGVLIGLFGVYGKLPLVSGGELRLASVLALVASAGLIGPGIGAYLPIDRAARTSLLVLAVLSCLVAYLFGPARTGRLVATGLALLTALLTMAALFSQDWGSSIGSDVYNAHHAAGFAMSNGSNPYSEAVSFVDGNPFGEAREFEGYPYPPVALMTYGLTSSFTDPRLITVISSVAFLGGLGWLAARRTSSEASTVALSSLLVLALSPLNGLVWLMAWTEPLTIILFAGAALTWRRSTTWSGVLLGLALASKQYLIFLLPLLLLHREKGWTRRSMIALGTAAVTLLGGLGPNPAGFLRAIVGNLTTIGFRPDTQSLPGLANDLGVGFVLPNWLWITLSLVFVALIARSSTTRAGFMVRAALGLGVAFSLGLAFPNYWFLVAGLLGIGLVLDTVDTSSGSTPEVETDSGQGSRQETRIAGV
jgi:hypothetical protein